MRVLRAASLCAAVVVAKHDSAASSSLSQAPGAGDAFAGASGRVAQLMTLLKKLKSDFNAEYDEARDAYDKQSCAHEDTVKSSHKSKDEAAASIMELDTALKKNSADVAALAATVKLNEQAIASKNKEIADAITHRQKEHTAYGVEVKEFNEAIRSAQLAYEVLTSAQDSSLKNTQSLLDLKSSKAKQRNLWMNIRTKLDTLPLNGKLMTLDKIEELTEFIDTRLSEPSLGETSASLIQFGPASQRVTGILKDMRGQFVAKLQNTQQAEQEAAASHTSFVNKTRELVNSMIDSMDGRNAELTAVTADKEANLIEKKAKKKEQTEMDTLYRETKAAQEALSKNWAETSASHNDEINGVNKAIDYLERQQLIGSENISLKSSLLVSNKNLTRVALLQIASANKKPLYDNMFQKIAWAVDDMVKTHQTTLSDNKHQREQCTTMQAEANSAAARMKAAIEALNRNISELKAESSSTLIAKKKLEGEKKDTEDEIVANQLAWEKSDNSRTLEVSQLTDTVRLITGATQALSESGSERMGDVTAILNMLKSESQLSLQALGKAKSSEAATWTEQKTVMANLCISLDDDIAKHAERITGFTSKILQAEDKKGQVASQVPMDTNACQAFLMAYQGVQDGLNEKIHDLSSAKSHLIGWKNSSTNAQHFDTA